MLMSCYLNAGWNHNTGAFLKLLTNLRLCASPQPCIASHEAHTNFADDSACLMANNVWNEGR
jgi:hypothetical protein